MSEVNNTTEIYVLMMNENDTNFYIPNEKINPLLLKTQDIDKIFLKNKNQSNIIGIIFPKKNIIRNIEDINPVGILVKVISKTQTIQFPNNYLCNIKTLQRFKIISILEVDGCVMKLRVSTEEEKKYDMTYDPDIRSLYISMKQLINKISEHNKYLAEPEKEEIKMTTLTEIKKEQDPGKFADKAAFACCPPSFFAQAENNQIFMVFNTLDPKERMEKVLQMLVQRFNGLRTIASVIEETNDYNRRKNQALLLTQYTQAITKKINEIDPDHKLGVKSHSCSKNEHEKFTQRLEEIKAHIPQKTYDTFLEKIEEFKKLDPHQSEYSRKHEWLKRVLIKIPWGVYTKDNLDIRRVKEILDRDHYGMEKVKMRMVEHAAVMALNENGGGIILLHGPPGVGKTSIGKGLAEALGRKFHRTSVGGARDESMIKGFLSTYMGSKYGIIINALINAESMNSIVMIDEVDKMSSDSHRGDPSAALLEVLDKEINHEFYDYYLEEIPVDLSKVLFILTANYLQNVPAPFLDRLEKIEQSSYTTEEKIRIGEEHLIKKAMTRTGLLKNDIPKLKLEDGIIKELVTKYVAESGVRELERVIEKLCRRFAVKIELKEITQFPHMIRKDEIINYLGIPKARPYIAPAQMKKGESLGMAYSEVGGCILSVETSILPGNGQREITGNIKEIMKESVSAALTSIKELIAENVIEDKDDKLNKNNIHIHVPRGAIPKEGPSAGIAIATSIISALLEKPIKPFISMTGEITSHGKVKAIGGLREKCISAANCEIKTIILPEENRVDIEHEVPELKDKINFIYVKTLKEVIEQVF